MSEKTENYTPDQLAEIRKNMLKSWEEEIPRLKLQLEFEELIAKIEEMRYRRTEFMLRRASLENPSDTSEKK